MPYIALAVGLALAGIDQLFKYLVTSNMHLGGEVKVFGDVFKIIYVENRGVAFGLFKDMPWLFIVLTVILMGLIIFYMFKKRPDSKLFYISVALIIGGGIGNLIDRIAYKYVVDYLSLSFFPPVCNFADYCITIGVIILAVYLLFFADKNDKNILKENVKEKADD